MTGQRKRPMTERVQDPDVVAWVKGRRLSDAATHRCQRVIAAWRREKRTAAQQAERAS